MSMVYVSDAHEFYRIVMLLRADLLLMIWLGTLTGETVLLHINVFLAKVILIETADLTIPVTKCPFV